MAKYTAGLLAAEHFRDAATGAYFHSIYPVADSADTLVRMGIARWAENKSGLHVHGLVEGARQRSDGSVVIQAFASRVIKHDDRFHAAMDRVITGAKLPDWKPAAPSPEGRAAPEQKPAPTAPVVTDERLIDVISHYCRCEESEIDRALVSLTRYLSRLRESARNADDDEQED